MKNCVRKPDTQFAFPNRKRTVANVMNAVTHVMEELQWDANRVARLMTEREIPNRSALAKTLGIGRATVNEAFNARWEGRATAYLIAVMCSYFQVRMADLVQEPLVQIRRMNNGHLQRVPNRAVS